MLDGRGLLKTISINSPEQSLTQVHVIKAVHDLMPVTLQLQGKVIKMNIKIQKTTEEIIVTQSYTEKTKQKNMSLIALCIKDNRLAVVQKKKRNKKRNR